MRSSEMKRPRPFPPTGPEPTRLLEGPRPRPRQVFSQLIMLGSCQRRPDRRTECDDVPAIGRSSHAIQFCSTSGGRNGAAALGLERTASSGYLARCAANQIPSHPGPSPSEERRSVV
jgi:hypothetical protein